MQKIVSQTRIDKRAKLNVLGSELYLLSPTSITGEIDAGDTQSPDKPAPKPGLHSFKDGTLPPCVMFGYDSKNTKGAVVQSLYQMAVDVFKFDPETSAGEDSIKMLISHAYEVAAQLKLEILEMENGMVVVSHILHDFAKEGNVSWKDVQNMGQSNRDMQLAMGNMGGATLLGEVVKTGTHIYDIFNYDKKIDSIVFIIQTMSKINPDGNAGNLSIADIEHMFSQIKRKLYLR